MSESWRPYRSNLDPRIGVISQDGNQGIFCEYDSDSDKTFFYYATLKDGTWITNRNTVVDLDGKFSNDRLGVKCMNMAKGIKIDGFF